MKFSSTGLGASHLYNDSDSGLADETTQTPCPCHLKQRVGPFASSVMFFTGQKICYITRCRPGTTVTSPAAYWESTGFSREKDVPTSRGFLQSNVAKLGYFRITENNDRFFRHLNIYYRKYKPYAAGIMPVNRTERKYWHHKLWRNESTDITNSEGTKVLTSQTLTARKYWHHKLW
jgi:hypothetical protein